MSRCRPHCPGVLARHSAAGELIDRLAHISSEVIARLRSLAAKIEPAPETLLIFGSFARGEADADSDLDVLAVRSPKATLRNGPASLSGFAQQAQALAGNQVQLLDYDLGELRRKAGPKAKEGREFWRRGSPRCHRARRFAVRGPLSAVHDDSPPWHPSLPSPQVMPRPTCPNRRRGSKRQSKASTPLDGMSLPVAQ